MDRSPNRSRCLTQAPARTTELGPDHAAVAHDRARLDDAAAADVAAVDHRARADHRVVVDDQFVIGQQMQHRVLQDLRPGADPTGPWESPMIFTPAPISEFSPMMTSPVISAESNTTVPAPINGVLSAVGVQRAHAFSGSHRPGHDRARVVGQVGLMLAQHRQPLTVGVGGRPDHMGRAPD